MNFLPSSHFAFSSFNFIKFLLVSCISLSHFLNSYSKVIEGNLVINKYYGDDNNYKLDEDAVFEIYNNNKIIKKVNNSGEIKLEYGDYLVRQISGKKCYDFTQEFSISIQQKNAKYLT